MPTQRWHDASSSCAHGCPSSRCRPMARRISGSHCDCHARHSVVGMYELQHALQPSCLHAFPFGSSHVMCNTHVGGHTQASLPQSEHCAPPGHIYYVVGLQAGQRFSDLRFRIESLFFDRAFIFRTRPETARRYFRFTFGPVS